MAIVIKFSQVVLILVSDRDYLTEKGQVGTEEELLELWNSFQGQVL